MQQMIFIADLIANKSV